MFVYILPPLRLLSRGDAEAEGGERGRQGEAGDASLSPLDRLSGHETELIQKMDTFFLRFWFKMVEIGIF